MYVIIIIFLIKASSRKAVRKKIWKELELLYLPFEQKIVKRFVQCHVFAQSPPGQLSNDKYPINTSHHSRFV